MRFRVALRAAIVLSALLALADPRLSAVHASPGDLDPTFGALTDLPLAAQATITGALAKSDDAFAARAAGPGAVALRNAQHDLTAEVTARGVTMSHADVRWQLNLQRWGRGADLQSVPAGQVVAQRNHVDIARKDLVEWYVNGTLGIEQGFTLGTSPSVTDGRPVVLELASSGSATLAMAKDGATLEVLGSDGIARLRYAGLTALDADGRTLPVAMRTTPGRLRIELDDRGARYPIVVDPMVQTARFAPAKPSDFLDYGYAIAISGDTLVVGVSNEPIKGPNHGVALHIFVRTGATWFNATEVAVIRFPEGAYDLGSVAIDGDTIVAGARGTRPGGIFPDAGGGAALVFVRSPGGWVDGPPTAILTTPDSTQTNPMLPPNQFFGNAVAIDGDTIVVGAFFFNINVQGSGAAYVFEKPLTGWVNASETARLTAAVPIFGEQLGSSVAISGDTIVVGAPDSSTGSALIYERPFAGWTSMTETAAIGASDGQLGDAFGWSAAIDGDTIVVGAVARAVGAFYHAGGVYVFAKPIGGWMSETETAILSPSIVNDYSRNGVSVAIAGSRIVTGASDRVYVFDEPVGGWAPMSESALLETSDGGLSFGDAVAVSTDGAIAGSAPNSSASGHEVVGSAYVFQEIAGAVPCPTTPSLGCAQAGKGQLLLKFNSEKQAGRQLKWKFSLGPELHRADFGDPVTATSYALCIYDDGVLTIAKPLLGGFGRWALSGTDAYAYANKDKTYAIGSFRKVQLKGGIAGKSAIQMQGKGADVGGMPRGQVSFEVLNATMSVQVQLQQAGGGCYETSFLPAGVKKNIWGYIDTVTFGTKGLFQAGY